MTSGFKMVALKSAVMTQEYRRKKKKKFSGVESRRQWREQGKPKLK